MIEIAVIAAIINIAITSSASAVSHPNTYKFVINKINVSQVTFFAYVTAKAIGGSLKDALNFTN